MKLPKDVSWCYPCGQPAQEIDFCYLPVYDCPKMLGQFLTKKTNMKLEQAVANVEIKYGDKVIKLKSLVDTGTSRSVVSKKFADELGAFMPLSKSYELGTANKGGKLKISGFCNVDIIFQGVEVPGGTRFEVAENLREDVDLIIGRPEIDAWDIVFTPEGPKPRKVPIEFEIL
jgi:Zn-finger protein